MNHDTPKWIASDVVVKFDMVQQGSVSDTCWYFDTNDDSNSIKRKNKSGYVMKCIHLEAIYFKWHLHVKIGLTLKHKQQ